MAHLHLYFAWSWMLTGMLVGAVVGLFFYRHDWLGGYDSWKRRMLRLGHIAFLGTGLLNLGFALSLAILDPDGGGDTLLFICSRLLLIGAVAMPLVCLASAWRDVARHLFFIPALSLIGAAAALVLRGVIQ